MRDLFYVELGKRLEEIRQLEMTQTPEETQKRNEYILEIVEEINRLSTIGRKEGLLALEEAAYQMNDENKSYLKQMICLIVDGTMPELVEEICFLRYMANGFHAYEGLEYMMQMVGILSMQAGENPRVIEEKLMSMVPEKVYHMFCQQRDAELKGWIEQPKEDIDMKMVELLYEGELNEELADSGYPELRKLDYLLKIISDRALQRALREIDNSDLELAMKALSGEGRRRIFINMSKRLCVMVAEDMENMGRGRKSLIGEAAQKVYYIFMKLMDYGDINVDESDEIYALYKEYKINEW